MRPRWFPPHLSTARDLHPLAASRLIPVRPFSCATIERVGTQRRRRGFEAAGVAGTNAIGLPVRRGRELSLAVAWRRVAGAPLAERTIEIHVRRGRLVIEVVDDAGWATGLSELLPQLAARFAAERPDLAISSCVLLRHGAGEVRRLESIEALEQPPVVKRPARAAGAIATAAGAPLPATQLRSRLERLGERYLEAAAAKRERQKP